MKTILLTGSLRSPPPFRLRRTFPHPGDRINRSMLPCRDMTPWLSTHSAPACGGKVVAPATKGGSPSPARRLYGFRRQRRHKKWRPKAPYLASAAILYNSRGREPSTRPGGVSRSRTEPWQPRAERPGGWLNPHARKGVSTFGNTGKHRSPGPDRATGVHFHPLNPGHPVAP